MRPRLGGRFATQKAELVVVPPPASIEDPGLRASVARRCDDLGVRLTDKRRRVVELFDLTPMPIDLDQVWWKAVELELDINRSSLHRLAADLVAAGVLCEIGPSDRRTRFATPPSVQVEIAAGEAEAATVEDPSLTEMLIEVLASRGVDVTRRRIVISVQD